jgi:K(+)-stimulated pyrophosphate-energized sodium pump
VVELSLILSVVALAAVLSASLTRWALAQAEGSSDAVRVLGAVQRAGDDFAWRQSKRAILASALLGTIFLAAQAAGIAGTETPGVAFSLLGAVGVGALLSVVTGQLAVQIAPRASARVSEAMLRATHTHAVSLGLRAGAAIGVGTEALALLSCAGVLLLYPLGSPDVYQRYAPLLLAGLALGAVTAAIWSQVTGAAVHCAGQVGRCDPSLGLPRERFEVSLQNPALILDMVGNHVGVSAPRAQEAFCTSMLLYAASLSVATWVWEANLATFANPLVLLSFPVLIRAFGLVAVSFAVFSSRADEGDDPAAVLWRAQVATSVIGLAAIAGVSVWLLPDGWLPWFAAAAIGLCANLVVGFARQQLVDRRAGALKELREATGLSESVLVSSGVASSLLSSWAPLLALVASLTLGTFLGQNSALPLGGAFGAALVACGFSMGMSYVTTLAMFDPIVDGGCSMASLEAQRRPEVHNRSARMSQVALGAGATGRGQLTILSALLGVLVVLDLPHTARVQLPLDAISTSPTLLLAGAAIGVFTILAGAGSALLHATRAARQLALELHRQLRSFARDASGIVELPESFRPRYGDHLTLGTSDALRLGALLPAAVLLAPPLVILLLALASDVAPSARAGVLMALLAFSTAAALSVGLCAEGTWGLLSSNRRHTRAKDRNQLASLASTDCTAEFVGNSLAPTAQLIAKGLLATTLVTALILF